jgi:hypothetical protein
MLGAIIGDIVGSVYPPAEAVPILVQTAQATLPRLHHLREIRFVAIDSGVLEIFQLHIRGNQ